MKDRLKNSNQMTFEDTGACIASLGSQVGSAPCNSQAGRQTDLFGAPAFPASRGPAPANKKAATMQDTSGRISLASSKSAGLSALLASKCGQRLSSIGSMEYSRTWKEKITPAGRLYWGHTASGRRTSAKEFSGWPTPNVPNGGRLGQPTNKHPDGSKKQVSCEEAATLAGWPTPNTMQGGQTSRGGERKDEALMGGIVQMVGWGTPRQTDAKCDHNYTPGMTGKDLAKDASLTGWTIPSSRDWKDTPGMATTATNPDGSERTRLDQLPRQAHAAGWSTPHAGSPNSLRGQGTDPEKRIAQGRQVGIQDQVRLISGLTPSGTTAETGNIGACRRVLNHRFSMWLMGFPPAWTAAGLRSIQTYFRSAKVKRGG